MGVERGLSTTCVHAGELADAHGAPHTPVYDSTTFGFPSTAALLDVVGGAESLVTQPVTTTHHGLSSEERARRGISDSMVRLSIGLEDAEDLISDLRQALGATA